jgi:hypothetical protein
MVMVVVGIAVTLSALVVQGVTSILAVEAISRLLARRAVGAHIWSNAFTTLMLIVVLLAGHLAQMAVWAMAFMAAGEFTAFASAFYHSAVNYTTLGYDDIVFTCHFGGFLCMNSTPRSPSGAASPGL